MKCPYCGEEMIRGYLMSSGDIAFAVDDVTKVKFFRIRKSDDLELSKGSGGIPPVSYTHLKKIADAADVVLKIHEGKLYHLV